MDRDLDVLWVDLHGVTAATELLGGDDRRAGPGEGFVDVAAVVYLAVASITFEIDATPVTGPTFLPIAPFVGSGVRGQSERASAT